MSGHSFADSLFELGQLYSDRCDFLLAIEKLSEASGYYFSEKNFSKFFECQNLLLRLYAETENQEKTNEIKETLQDLVLKEGFVLSAKTLYTLGLCATYKKQFDVAQDYLKKSLNAALKEDNKKDVCYALHGIAIVYLLQGRYLDALNEIYNLQVSFQVLDIPELKTSAHFVNGYIQRMLKKYDNALEIYWLCYDDLKRSKNLFQYLYLLYNIGATYLDMGKNDLARVYLALARKSYDPDNMVNFSKLLEVEYKRLGSDSYAEFDLVLQKSSNTIYESKIGKVDFKNQFILMDLLRLFSLNPGHVFSKEDLVKEVWAQEYNPSTHDNKIYVTIKRLRQMIEPDIDKPKYIYRAKNGYYLNNEAKILIEQ